MSKSHRVMCSQAPGIRMWPSLGGISLPTKALLDHVAYCPLFPNEQTQQRRGGTCLASHSRLMALPKLHTQAPRLIIPSLDPPKSTKQDELKVIIFSRLSQGAEVPLLKQTHASLHQAGKCLSSAQTVRCRGTVSVLRPLPTGTRTNEMSIQ